MSRVAIGALALAAACRPLPAQAWGEGGHRMVAQIAYGRLTPRAKAAVKKLLETPLPPTEVTRQSRDFVSAAVWADEIKSEPGFERFGPWHYIDNPFGVTPNTPLPPGLPEKENVIVALRQEVAILRNPKAKPEKKAEALRFLLHFVGDVHQPLHCATRVSPLHPEGDRGGNEYRIRQTGGGKTESLHAYWDHGLNTFPRADSGVPAAAARAQQQNPASDSGWKAGGPMDFSRWMRESEWLARNTVYEGLRRGKQPPDDYVRRGVRIANKRVAWAGYRLAALLNAIYAGG